MSKIVEADGLSVTAGEGIDDQASCSFCGSETSTSNVVEYGSPESNRYKCSLCLSKGMSSENNTPPKQYGIPVKPGLYKHFKGTVYLVYGTTEHTETGERLVLYSSLGDQKTLWSRPENMFFDIVRSDNKSVRRFTPYRIKKDETPLRFASSTVTNWLLGKDA